MYSNENWFVILFSCVYFGDWVTKIYHFSPLKTNNSAQLRTQPIQPTDFSVAYFFDYVLATHFVTASLMLLNFASQLNYLAAIIETRNHIKVIIYFQTSVTFTFLFQADK